VLFREPSSGATGVHGLTSIAVAVAQTLLIAGLVVERRRRHAEVEAGGARGDGAPSAAARWARWRPPARAEPTIERHLQNAVRRR
jgi:hypothetical protein